MIANTTNDNWLILPLTAFQEASTIFNIGAIKRDPITTQEAFTMLSYVVYLIFGVEYF